MLSQTFTNLEDTTLEQEFFPSEDVAFMEEFYESDYDDFEVYVEIQQARGE